jgi:hypothetical protein
VRRLAEEHIPRVADALEKGIEIRRTAQRSSALEQLARERADLAALVW